MACSTHCTIHPARRGSALWKLTWAYALACGSAMAQTQVVKPPVAQYWMDVATLSMAGMDDLPDMAGMSGLGGLMGGMSGGRSAGQSSFGLTKGMSPGRWLDLAVTTRLKPGGTQATQAIPTGLAMGPSLVLLPPPAEPIRRTPRPETDGLTRDEVPQQPKGRILLYWGCSETIRPGQPKVLDFAKAGFEDYGRFMAGRSDRELGATAAPGHAVWPNPQHGQRVPKGASLTGPHAISGEGIPESLRFTLGQTQDFMPRLDITSQGGGAASTRLQWTSLPTAKAYFFNAMGGGEDDMVIWSSSEVPEPGWGLLSYLSPPNVDKWLSEQVLLPNSQTRCAIPAGVFAKVGGGMVQGIAYGPELNLVHPPRPTDPQQPWLQEWVARVRVKSATMLPLEEMATRPAARRSNPAEPAQSPAGETAVDVSDTPNEPPSTESANRNLPSLPNLPGVGNVLKGLFGR